MTRLSGQFDDCRETALDTFEIGRAGKFDSDPGDRGGDNRVCAARSVAPDIPHPTPAHRHAVEYPAEADRVRKISAAGAVSTVAGFTPAGVAVDSSDNLYISDFLESDLST